MVKSPDFDVVLFDLGRVLLDFDHHISARKIAEISKKDEDYIYNLFFESELVDLFDTGKITPQEFFLKVKEMLDLNMDYEDFLPVWNEVFFENAEVSNLVRELKKDYTVMLISNVNVLQFSYIKEKFKIIDQFDKVILSYQVGTKKPDPLIFQAAIKAAKAPPERIIYTDDRPELVEGGRQVGLKAILFQGPDQFKGELARLGIR